MESKFYVARDDDGTLWLYQGKPSRREFSWRTPDSGTAMSLPQNLFNIDTSTILEVEIREKSCPLKDIFDQEVEITLTAHGAKILNIQQDEFLKEHPDIKLKFKNWYEGDKYRAQLRSIMESFGSNQDKIAFTNLKKI